MLIGICGRISSGKSTLAGILCEQYDFVEYSFAKKLKDIVSILFDWDRRLLVGDTEESRTFREKKDEYWSEKLGMTITPRLMLQNVGTSLRNSISDDIWINTVVQFSNKNVNNTNNVVISDCRYINELNYIRNNGGVLILMKRDVTNPTNPINPTSTNNHESDKLQDDDFYDIIIDNNGDIDNLRRVIDGVIRSVIDN
jgi:hypothetical protein